ncbi:unnamed protein product [marine sediment metagenome]|uniref:30S ribosomal protein S21 n=1 Tax=marine sediment metagenome TaxID=412755 RepID=X1IV52_9ZZZZ
MPLRANRQGRESSQGLVRRFSQKIRKSGILLEARKKRFKGREKSQQLKKRSALRKEKKRQEYQKLKKMGKI